MNDAVPVESPTIARLITTWTPEGIVLRALLTDGTSGRLGGPVREVGVDVIGDNPLLSVIGEDGHGPATTPLQAGFVPLKRKYTKQ